MLGAMRAAVVQKKTAAAAGSIALVRRLADQMLGAMRAAAAQKKAAAATSPQAAAGMSRPGLRCRACAVASASHVEKIC